MESLCFSIFIGIFFYSIAKGEGSSLIRFPTLPEIFGNCAITYYHAEKAIHFTESHLNLQASDSKMLLTLKRTFEEDNIPLLYIVIKNFDNQNQ